MRQAVSVLTFSILFAVVAAPCFGQTSSATPDPCDCNCDPGATCLTDADCDDSNACNGTESCEAGTCLSGTELSCDDGNVCNGLEYCSPSDGCQTAEPPQCDDNDICNGFEACDPVMGCMLGEPQVCPGCGAELSHCDPQDGCSCVPFPCALIDCSPGNCVPLTGQCEFFGPPVVPDGQWGGLPLLADKLDPFGDVMVIFYDNLFCPDAFSHQMLFGQGSQLPNNNGGIYGLSGAACFIGNSGKFFWRGVPALGPDQMLWWVVTTTDGGTTEGSWGLSSDNVERQGPGPDGVSGQCGMVAKETINNCGQ